MADNTRYLDFEGLKQYDSKLKEFVDYKLKIVDYITNDEIKEIADREPTGDVVFSDPRMKELSERVDSVESTLKMIETSLQSI